VCQASKHTAKGVYAVSPARKAHGKDQNLIEKISAVKFTARFKILYICCHGGETKN
jgi:hypothetical protein